jgi:uroporphyrinogen-III decarboxylase
MEEKKGPVIHNPLKQPADIAGLTPPNAEYLEHVYDALFLTRLALKGSVYLSLSSKVTKPWLGFVEDHGLFSPI